MAEGHTYAVEDSTLESMTTALLQVSSVFLVQQNELQEVHSRLQKELARMLTIQNALADAAQQHQDAVLNVIQNYESLSIAAEGGSSPPSSSAAAVPPFPAELPASLGRARADSSFSEAPSAPVGRTMSFPTQTRANRSSSSASATAAPDLTSRRSVRQLHLPPVANELKFFEPIPKEKPPKPEGTGDDDDDDGEGIQYVENLNVIGGVLGTVLKANGEFVDRRLTTFQWLRRKHVAGVPTFIPIEGATNDVYIPNADDVNTILRLDVQPPYGGELLRVETGAIAVDPSTHQTLEALMRRGHAEFNCNTTNGEPRILLITRKNIKVRSRLSRITTSATTIYKQSYEQPLTIALDVHTQTEISLRLGGHAFALAFDTSRTRDLAALCVRMFAGPECPEHADAYDGVTVRGREAELLAPARLPLALPSRDPRPASPRPRPGVPRPPRARAAPLHTS